MLCLEQFLRRAFEHDRAAFAAAFGTHVNDPIGVLDDVQIVLDDNDRVARVHEAVDDLHEVTDIGHVQARGRFVHDVDTALFVQFAGEFDALTFTAR